eukprot:scaffold52676_cov63-Phaeocystis_antarctica.AAC.2
MLRLLSPPVSPGPAESAMGSPPPLYVLRAIRAYIRHEKKRHAHGTVGTVNVPLNSYYIKDSRELIPSDPQPVVCQLLWKRRTFCGERLRENPVRGPAAAPRARGHERGEPSARKYLVS